jgi:NTP pyrophosphatase (non-canonical NTP hydrolase)
MSVDRLRHYAAIIRRELWKYFPPSEEQERQVMCMAEEVGEFVGAARRYMGKARRSGTKEEMAMELADVVITAFVTAEVFDIKLNAEITSKLSEILTRGWKDDTQEIL